MIIFLWKSLFVTNCNVPGPTDVAKTLLDKTAPADGDVLPGLKVSTLLYMIRGCSKSFIVHR
jgi:hypothetical protein